LMEAYEHALEQRLGSDATVVVLRSVHSRQLLPLSQTTTDQQLARRWGERMAASVLCRISDAGPGDRDVVKFANQADYLACFVSDLMQGQAWDRWYYGAFRYLRGLSFNEVVRRLLLDNRDHMGATLVLLEQRRLLSGLLSAVDAPVRLALWYQGLRHWSGAVQTLTLPDALELYSSWVRQGLLARPAEADAAFCKRLDQLLAELPWLDGTGIKRKILSHLGIEGGSIIESAADADRALFDQACRLIDLLQLWGQQRLEIDELYQRYRPQVVSDWRDQRALTQAVVDALEYLQRAGQIRQVTGPDLDRLLPRLESALSTYSWLDTLRLRSRLLELLCDDRGALRTHRRAALTPRQTMLIETLRLAMGQLDESADEDVPGWSMRLYARLIETHSGWAGDTLALRLVEALAYLRMLLKSSSLAPQVVRAIQTGEVTPLLNQLPRGTPTGTAEGLRLLVSLGPPVACLLDRGSSPADHQILWRDTECAGVLLLLRAVADLKLPSICRNRRYPPGEEKHRVADLILSLLLRLAGSGAIHESEIDGGLSQALSAGVSARSELKSRWDSANDSDHRGFQQALFNIAAGQRLVTGQRLHLYLLNQTEAGPALIVGDGQGLVWPLGTSMPEGLFTHETISSGWDRVRAWLDDWRQAFAHAPQQLLADACFSDWGLADLGLPLTLVDSSDEPEAETEQAGQSHREERRALMESLRALESQGLSSPGTDLSINLAALLLLRSWARWLPRFSTASVAFLLQNLIHRQGRVGVNGKTLWVELDPAPLDVVMEMAGFLGELAPIDWLGGRGVIYSIRR
jgi:hypothetical protein